MKRRKNVLLTCAGKSVGIVVQLKETMRAIPALSHGKLIVSSTENLTPAGCFADEAVVVLPFVHPGYVEHMIDLCTKLDVGVLISETDLEMERIAPFAEDFRNAGTTVICPPEGVVKLCLDKVLFHQFLDEEALPHPRVYSAQELARARYPLFQKRRKGSGSMGAGIALSYDHSLHILQDDPDTIFQEFVNATEITLDAYVSRATQRLLVCVQRVRDQVVGGQSYKAHTVMIPAVRDLARRAIDGLVRRGAFGPMNLQIFVTDPPTMIEANPRLGSGSVLSNQAAKGRLLHAVLHEASGGVDDGDPDDYLVGLRLSRYLGDVFHGGDGQIVVKPGRQ